MNATIDAQQAIGRHRPLETGMGGFPAGTGRTISHRLIKTRAAESETKQPVKEEKASWSVETKRVALSRFKVVFDDRSLATPARIVVSRLAVRGENFSNLQNSRGKATLQATINDKGNNSGQWGPPVTGRLEVDAQGLTSSLSAYLEISQLCTSGMIEQG
jgi:hypothetical protein